MQYPDPEDEFYGYTYKQRTTVFHSVVCAVTTAIIASQTRKYVLRKSDCLRPYKEHINDKWTPLVSGAYEMCRGEWDYYAPESATDRKLLRDLCRQTLEFENHFLKLYKDYLLSELKHADDNNKLYAVQQFGEIIYPDEKVLSALRALEDCEDEELRAAVKETIGRIQTVRE